MIHQRQVLMSSEITSINSPYEVPSYTPCSFYHAVSAGFPSPAADYEEGKLDLNEEFIKSPSSTFFVRVTGDSMIGIGIFPLAPKHDSVVIAIVNNELTVKKLYMRGRTIELHAENERYKPIEFKEESDLEIWGVVTSAIRRF
jgi:DNA polymerase V